MKLSFLGFILISLAQVSAQTGILSTAAGNGSTIYSGDNIPASLASVGSPAYVAVDQSGNLYIADSGNSRILKVNGLTGILTSIAGGGSGGDGGLATNALLNAPCGIRVDSVGNVFVSESCVAASSGIGGGGAPTFGTGRIRRIDAVTGLINTVAGNGLGNVLGDNGPATSAGLNGPGGLAFDSIGRLYVADSFNQRIRRIDLSTGIITTVAGNGSANFITDGGPATLSWLNFPAAVATDAQGNIYIADAANSRVRKVDALTGLMSTVAGSGVSGFNGDGIPATSAQIAFPTDVQVDAAGNIYFVDFGNARIRRVDATTGVISTVAGGGFQAATDGLAAVNAILNRPFGLTLGSNNRLYFSDRNASKVWVLNLPASLTPSTTTLSIQPNAVAPNEPVTFTVSVSPTTATGSIEFLVNGIPTSMVPLVNGGATLNTVLTNAGTFTIVARYVGNSEIAGSSSSPVTVAAKNNTTTLLASNVSSAATGQTVTFNVTVIPNTATGIVQFLNGTTNLGSVQLDFGAASFSTSQLPAGANLITASYGGDSANNASTSSPIAVSIKANSMVSLDSSANPATVGQTVTFTASVSPSTATGSVEFYKGGAPIGVANVNNGVAILANPQLTAGSFAITANYLGDNFTAASGTMFSQSVKGSSSVSLSSSVNPANVGQAVTVTATVSPATASGTVEFRNGNTIIGTAPLLNGVAAFVTAQLPAGSYNLIATYGGDSLTAASSSLPINQTVKAATTTTVSSSANPSRAGQPVTLTATVSPATASGSIQFFNGSTLIGTASLVGGAASLVTAPLDRGTFLISAKYAGDSLNSGSSSALLNQVVKTASTVTLSSGNNPANAGQIVTFFARVSPTTATGTVQFLNGATVLATVAVTNGVASFATRDLAAGTYSLVANYSGDNTFLASSSSPLSQTIKARAVVTLSSSVNPAIVGQMVSFNTTIVPSTATGSIQFMRGETVLGSATLVNGSASFATNQLPAGISMINARYSGDSLNTPDTSNGIRQVVKVPSSVAITTSVNPSTAGEPVTFTATVSPATATGVVQFLNGSTSLGSARVNNGVARLTSSRLVAGSFTITANYVGDTLTAGSSASLAQSVNVAMPACRVVYNVTSQTDLSFVTSISIQNTGTATFEPWALTFAWPGNQMITQAVNAGFVQNGRSVRMTAIPANRAIAPGATLTGIGFNANYSGTNATPSAFSVNGVRCQ